MLLYLKFEPSHPGEEIYQSFNMFGYSLTLGNNYGTVLPETKQDKHKKPTEMPDYKQNGG